MMHNGAVWKAITFLCGHSLLRDVVLSLCVVVSPLCDVVLSLCDVVSPLRGVVSSLCHFLAYPSCKNAIYASRYLCSLSS